MSNSILKPIAVAVMLAVAPLSISSAQAAVKVGSYIGIWSAKTSYAAGDLITLNNKTFLSLVARNLNKNPDTNPASWQLLGGVGAMGLQGPIGAQGLQGLKGDAGAAGINGSIGPKGDTGLQGLIGLTGAKGDTGLQGLIGDIGAKGDTGVAGTNGLDGAVGPKGDTGLQGPAGADSTVVGPVGPRGPAGIPTSGTDVGDMQYWDGTNWVMVPVGKNNETLKSCEGVPTWVVAICPGFTLGGTGPAGGKVVKLLNGTGSHGIEMTKVIEVNGSFSWGCNGTYISGTSVAFGTGQANTNAILAGCTEPNIAAKIADDYSLNGFDNWYLPSKDELDLFNGTYGSDAWSSSEISADKAWVFSQGSWRDNAPKSFSYSIFVVRNY